MTDMHDTADLVSKALRRAWQLGQTYWQQADSEYQSHWKKADATQATFDQLVEDTRAAILTSNSGAQPAPSGEDDAVRKSWARFSNELHRSPDAPYPGMSEAFERHFSQSFTAREWRAESGVWAAAWKAAKNHGAQPAPSVPDVWLPVPEKHPTFDPVDLQLSDGSVLCGCVPQSDGDYWWEGPSGEVFIDPRYAPVTHWRLSAAAHERSEYPEAKP